MNESSFDRSALNRLIVVNISANPIKTNYPSNKNIAFEACSKQGVFSLQALF